MALGHYESQSFVAASPQQVFSFVDDHAQFSSHMSDSSLMMAGSHMDVDLDAAKGQAVGSHIRMRGRMMGLPLELDEVVTYRKPPATKVWTTVGTPHLLIIGGYTMGVHIGPDANGARLQVFIDYELPARGIGRWLGRIFSGLYARWCVKQMITGTVRHFATA
jgi:hypothetical protein